MPKVQGTVVDCVHGYPAPRVDRAGLPKRSRMGRIRRRARSRKNAPAHGCARGQAADGAQGGTRPPGALEPRSGGERLKLVDVRLDALGDQPATRCCAATPRSMPCLPAATAFSATALTSARSPGAPWGPCRSSAPARRPRSRRPAMLDAAIACIASRTTLCTSCAAARFASGDRTRPRHRTLEP